jgi:hypothetical protein
MTLRYAKGEELDASTAEWQTPGLFDFLKMIYPLEEAEAERKLCVVVDAYTGKIHTAPGNAVYRFNEMKAACADIAERWPAIAPPKECHSLAEHRPKLGHYRLFLCLIGWKPYRLAESKGQDCIQSASPLRQTVQTSAEKLAHRMLAANGLAAIWDLQSAAGVAFERGKLAVAVSLIEIAEAAVEQWLGRHPSDEDRSPQKAGR